MKKNVFAIAPGAPFLKTFVRAFLDGRVVEGFSARLGPLALAEATIYVPTRRAARALADEFCRASAAGVALLPRILPLGALEETEAELIFEAAAEGDASPLELPSPMGDIERRMQLAELILAWARRMRHAVVRIEADGALVCDEREPLLVAATPADAFALSGDLARLIDELAIEDVAWRRLDALAGGFDDYWRVTLGFLDIAITHWPQILQERGLVDKAQRQIALIEKQERALRENPRGPVVAIGSTGTNRAAARLLDAVAGAPQGAIVLPGLDLGLDEAAFALIGRTSEGVHEEQTFTHPQAMLARLLAALKISRADVTPLGAPSPAQAARERFIAQALLPAEATDGWIAYRAGLDRDRLDEALSGVALIEALDEREEALALAIAMRETLERPGATAALVTPDRELARRVGAELLRWGLSVDDSGGEPLGASEAGLMARLAAAAAAERMSAQSIAALTAHRRIRLGLPAATIARLAPLLDIGVLRSRAATLLCEPAAAIAAAEASAGDPHAHPAAQRIFPREAAALRDLLERLGAALAPMLELEGEHDLARWVKAHAATLEALAADEAGEADFAEDDEALAALFDDLRASSTPSMLFDADAYLHFFASVAGEVLLRGPARAHPRLKILGLIEARLMDADVMLLGGLDEAVWPPQARVDAFLNRPMRAALGLTPPERRLGQSAHDFMMAMGRGRVILSRAQKRGGSPTVASRFLQRLAALGDAQWAKCAGRGAAYLGLARRIDRPDGEPPALKRPEPRPPLELRPTALSVTRIETLRRDPYAIYAERILGLLPLDAVGAPPGAGETGSAVHAAIERFSSACGAGPLPAGGREAFRALLLQELAAQIADPDFCAFYLPRLERMIDFYLGFERRRRETLAGLKTEVAGKLEFQLADGSSFALSARADRIELARDGALALIDFKTGEPPGKDEIKVGFAPQLTLEAAMARRGAFDLGASCAGRPISALYVKLNGPGGGKIVDVSFKDRTLEDVAEEHFRELVAMLDQFRDPAAAYPPRPFPKFARREGPYDHLARVREWAVSEAQDG